MVSMKMISCLSFSEHFRLALCAFVLANCDISNETNFVKFSPGGNQKNKSLGSIIDSKNDIERKMVIANNAFTKYDKLWVKKKIVSEKTLLRLYNAFVTPISIYNASSLAAPEEDIKS